MTMNKEEKMLLNDFRVIYSGNSHAGYLVQKVYNNDIVELVKQYKTYDAAVTDAYWRQLCFDNSKGK